jgi:hypothetical protein
MEQDKKILLADAIELFQAYVPVFLGPFATIRGPLSALFLLQKSAK